MLSSLLPLLTLTLLTTQLTYAEEPPKDPFMWCEAGPGPSIAQGLPPSFSEAKYPNVMSVCSLLNGPPLRTIGCVCGSTGGALYCRDRLADKRLWTASYHDDSMSIDLPRYCIHKCDCRRKWSQASTTDETGVQKVGGRQLFNASSVSAGGVNNLPGNENSVVIGQTGGNVTLDKCRGPCDSNADCSLADDCMCQTQSESLGSEGGGGNAINAFCTKASGD